LRGPGPRKIARVIQQNIGLSLAAIAALDPAALTGHISLAAGLLLNEGGAIVIIANKPGVPSAGRWQRILLAPMMLVRRR